MARDGSGNMSIPYPDFVEGTTIVAPQVEANFSTIADEITKSIAADGQTVVTADIPMNGHKFTGLAAGSAATDGVNFGQVQGQACLWCGTAGGTGANPENALTLAPAPPATAYQAGQTFRFIAAADNTGAATVNISGLGAAEIRNNGAPLAAGDIKQGQFYEIVHDGARFQLVWRAAPSEFIKTLMDDTSAAAARSTLGVVIGTDVQAYDPDLAAIAGLTSAADKLVYYTGAASAALASFTAQARQLLDDTSFSAMRATLGLVINSNVNQYLTTMSQAEAEAGTDINRRIVTAERLKQAIAAQAAGGGVNVATFNSSGSYTPTAGAKLLYIQVWGGGGGGARNSGIGNPAGGGGGGGYASGFYLAGRLSAVAPVSITVGGGGFGKTISNGSGQPGASSSVVGFLSAGGGLGGTTGGTGSGGTPTMTITPLTQQTESGGNASSPSAEYAGGAGIDPNGFGPGLSIVGGGGGGVAGNGFVPGGGGGGAWGNDAGNGAKGKVVITEFLQ